MQISGNAGNCWKLYDNYVINGHWHGGNPFFYTVRRLYLSLSNPSLVAETDFQNRFRAFFVKKEDICMYISKQRHTMLVTRSCEILNLKCNVEFI
jgi:hypothetical protein